MGICNRRSFFRTDLASELYSALEEEYSRAHKGMPDGIRFYERVRGEMRVECVEVLNEDGAKLFEKPVGTYLTCYPEDPRMLTADGLESAVEALAEEIAGIAGLCADKPSCVLICGLGNRTMTADAVGPFSVDRLTVTRHWDGAEATRSGALPGPALCALAPGVLGQTGIETLELVRGAVQAAHPQLVVLIDALAARETERLYKTVQLSSSGIEPGGGVGNRRAAIGQKTLGVPVMTVGVPTVIDAGTLLFDALTEAELGVETMQATMLTRLEGVFDRASHLFVTPKDADRLTVAFSRLLANALMRAFLGEAGRGLSDLI